MNQSSRAPNLRRLIAAALLAALFALSVAAPASAVTIDPPTTLAIDSVDIFQVAIASGDILAVVNYHICYGADCATGIPATPANQSHIIRMFNASSTEIGRTVPVVFGNNTYNGYHYGTASIYLTPSEATGLWGTAVSFTIEGNPTLSWTGPILVATFNTPSWNTSLLQILTQAQVYNNIANRAGFLTTTWNIANLYLTTSVSGSTKLASTGDTYFSQAVPNLRIIAPGLFTSSVAAPKFTDKYVGTPTPSVVPRAGALALTNRFGSTSIGTAINNGVPGLLGISGIVLTSALWFAGGMTLGILLGMKINDMRPVVFLEIPWFIGGTLIGVFSPVALIVVAFFCVVGIVFVLFYRGAS